MVDFGGPNNNQPQPHLQAFKDAASSWASDKTQIKVDSNTGNVGTRSLIRRAWRAATPASSGRRKSNKSDIKSFKDALLKRYNKRIEKNHVRAALDDVLPGHRDGNVPLTAGAVRRTIKQIDIETMTVASAVKDRRFRNIARGDNIARGEKNIARGKNATEHLSFYLLARDILRDGRILIDAQRFKQLFDRFIPHGSRREINIDAKLYGRMLNFVEGNNVKQYDHDQSAEARKLLEAAKREARNMLRNGALVEFKETLRRELDQR